jgi:hypothetical protein
MQASAAPKGTIGKPKGLKPGAIKAKPAAKATKPSREARLNRAAATAKRIAKSRKLKADTAGAAFAERRRISSRASSKARSAAFAKEATAGKQSATAMRSWLRAENRAESLRGSANQARLAAQAKPASKPASKPAPSAATIAQVGRERRATRNLNAAMKREGEGPNSKASRSASVAKRARAIYAGKVDPKAKTGARLTKTTDSEALRKRMKKMKDNNAAKPAAKPVRRGSGITTAKAERIVARVDANRPGQRRAIGSARRNSNALKTQERATAFLLAPSRRALKRGQRIGTTESVRRAIANARKAR